METASATHPCILSDIEATVPYKENCCVYLLSVESPIRRLYVQKKEWKVDVSTQNISSGRFSFPYTFFSLCIAVRHDIIYLTVDLSIYLIFTPENINFLVYYIKFQVL